jgi:hypothetical protein
MSFFTSSMPVSRMAASRWRWNSPAMPRSLVTYLAMVRSIFGRSLGPTTMRAITAITMSSLMLNPKSNIAVLQSEAST